MEIIILSILCIILCITSIVFGIRFYQEKRRANYLENLHRYNMFPKR